MPTNDLGAPIADHAHLAVPPSLQLETSDITSWQPPSRPSSPTASIQSDFSIHHAGASSSSAHPAPIYWHGGPRLRSRNIVASPSRPPSVRHSSQVNLHHSHNISRISLGSFFGAVRVEGPDGQPVRDSDIAQPAPVVAGPVKDELGLNVITSEQLEDVKYQSTERVPVNCEDINALTLIPPAKTEFAHFEERMLPPGWQRCVAPEGNVFYYHKENRIFTLSNVTKPANSTWIEHTYERALAHRRHSLNDLPEDTDIVLDCATEGYYLASWSKQCLFWLSAVPVHYITGSARPTVSETHLQHMLRNLFWCAYLGARHVSIFPNIYALTEDYVDEMKAIISFGHADFVSSETSMWSYDPEMNAHISRFLHKVDIRKPNPFYTNAFARYMDIFTFERFLFFYGEPYARLSRNEGVLEQYCHTTPNSRLFRIISPFLFWQPKLYFTELQKVYADQTVHYHSWRKFITVLKNDWKISLTPATVLLAADVGFLAIQSVDNAPGSPHRSAAQIACYISSLFGLANMATVQVLLRRHRQHLYDTATRGLEFLAEQDDALGGLELLAITVSLPGAFFGWSMLSLLAAWIFIFYHNTSFPTKITLSIVEAMLFITACILFVGGKKLTGSLVWQKLSKWSPKEFVGTWSRVTKRTIRKRRRSLDTDRDSVKLSIRSGRPMEHRSLASRCDSAATVLVPAPSPTLCSAV